MPYIKLKSRMMLSMRGISSKTNNSLCCLMVLDQSTKNDVGDEKFIFGANDKFEVQRGLNNVFALLKYVELHYVLVVVAAPSSSSLNEFSGSLVD